MHASVPGKVYQPFNTKFNFTVLCGNCHAKNQLYPFKLRPHQQQCRSNVRLCGSNIGSNIGLCQKNRSTCSTCNIRQCCFDVVAGVDAALDVQLQYTNVTHTHTHARTHTQLTEQTRLCNTVSSCIYLD